jgi:glyoxylase-like metal-dependent hydrolase (beta-lactamase superfamily II)
MIVRQYEVGSLSVFAYLVADEKTKVGLFIDPAAETDKLVREAESLSLEIKYIVNTHSHIDHVMGNREMVKKTGARIVIHESDAGTLVRPPAYLLEMFNATASPPADVLVREGDLIEAGGVSLRVLHTPGHSPGAICLYQEGMVFTGDTLFVGGVGRTDFPGCSWEDLENSIRTKLFTLPGKTIVYPGHQYGATSTSTIDHEIRHNPFVRG